MLATPSNICTSLSKPNPNPPCGALPNRRRSKYLDPVATKLQVVHNLWITSSRMSAIQIDVQIHRDRTYHWSCWESGTARWSTSSRSSLRLPPHISPTSGPNKSTAATCHTHVQATVKAIYMPSAGGARTIKVTTVFTTHSFMVLVHTRVEWLQRFWVVGDKDWYIIAAMWHNISLMFFAQVITPLQQQLDNT